MVDGACGLPMEPAANPVGEAPKPDPGGTTNQLLLSRFIFDHQVLGKNIVYHFPNKIFKLFVKDLINKEFVSETLNPC